LPPYVADHAIALRPDGTPGKANAAMARVDPEAEINRGTPRAADLRGVIEFTIPI
jgi:hypothetical protein